MGLRLRASGFRRQEEDGLKYEDTMRRLESNL